MSIQDHLAAPLGPFEAKYATEYTAAAFRKIAGWSVFTYFSVKESIRLFREVVLNIEDVSSKAQAANSVTGSLEAANAATGNADFLDILEKVNYLFPIQEAISLLVSLLTFWVSAWVVRQMLTIYKIIPGKKT
jgi:hypothetical protein